MVDTIGSSAPALGRLQRTLTIYQDFSLEDFRLMLGAEDGKYPAFGALNKHVIKPVVMEINALAPFNVSILPIKTGKKVTQIRVGWWSKTKEEMHEAWEELHRSKVGRKARISKQVVTVFEPSPSESRLVRNDPYLNDARKKV